MTAQLLLSLLLKMVSPSLFGQDWLCSIQPSLETFWLNIYAESETAEWRSALYPAVQSRDLKQLQFCHHFLIKSFIHKIMQNEWPVAFQSAICFRSVRCQSCSPTPNSQLWNFKTVYFSLPVKTTFISYYKQMFWGFSSVWWVMAAGTVKQWFFQLVDELPPIRRLWMWSNNNRSQMKRL